MSARMIADSTAFHPITPNVRQVDAFGRYTAAAGHALATSDAFPPSWRDRMAFVCGPTGHLLGGYRIEPEGSGYRARNAFSLVASSDEWFSPVAAEVGPDGHLWIADWYNFIIQHNPTPSAGRGGYDAQRGAGNAHINPNRDRLHGRIYRLVPEEAPERAPRKSLAGAGPGELAEALSDPNLFWRLQAQRLLVEGGAAEAVPGLGRKVVGAEPGAIHALWALHGMGRLERSVHQAALLSGDPALRRNAIRALGTGPEAERLLFDTAVVADPDPNVRREAFARLAHLEGEASPVLRRAVPRLLADPTNRRDPWLHLALRALAQRHGISPGNLSWGPNLLPNPSFEEGSGDRPEGWSPQFYSAPNRTGFTVASGGGQARDGRRALRISSDQGADAGWRARVEVEPDTEYRLSGWIRTQGVQGAMGALLNVHGMEGALSEAVQGDSGWTEVSFVFGSAGRREVTVNALFGGWGRSTGTAWYDSLSLQKAVYSAGGDGGEEPPGEGDPVRGRRLFAEDPVASCIRCHQVGGEGGAVGPALDGIALIRTEEHLRASLLDPQAEIAEGFPSEVSPMPPFGVLLAPGEIEDILAYLKTLQTPLRPGDQVRPRPISFE